MNKEVVEVLSEGLSEEQKNYFIDTLKNISQNEAALSERGKKSQVYPTESGLLAINFDKIKEIYTNTILKQVYRAPKSNDALYIFGKKGSCEWYFIEFKAGGIDNALTDELYKKIYDSVVIMMDLDRLNQGKLAAKNGKICLISTEEGTFGLADKLKKLGFRQDISFMRENFHYILVYNKELHEENDRDKMGYKAELQRGNYKQLEQTLKRFPWFWSEFPGAFECIEQKIEQRKFGLLCEQAELLAKFTGEYRELFEFLDEHSEWKAQILETEQKIKGRLEHEVQDISQQRAEEIFRFVLKNCDMSRKKINVFKTMIEKAKELKNSEEDKYQEYLTQLEKTDYRLTRMPPQDKKRYLQSDILKGDFAVEIEEFKTTGKEREKRAGIYLQKLIDALLEKSKIPQRCFYLHQFENYLFKEVRTLDMEEFRTFFVEKYERKESSLA